jgi:hypothetical protein
MYITDTCTYISLSRSQGHEPVADPHLHLAQSIHPGVPTPKVDEFVPQPGILTSGRRCCCSAGVPHLQEIADPTVGLCIGT